MCLGPLMEAKKGRLWMAVQMGGDYSCAARAGLVFDCCPLPCMTVRNTLRQKGSSDPPGIIRWYAISLDSSVMVKSSRGDVLLTGSVVCCVPSARMPPQLWQRGMLMRAGIADCRHVSECVPAGWLSWLDSREVMLC